MSVSSSNLSVLAQNSARPNESKPSGNEWLLLLLYTKWAWVHVCDGACTLLPV